MKISTKGRYGIRLMLDLALQHGNGPVLLKDIAQRTSISEKYLWQIISSLKNAGLVNSTRGSKGGYTIARNPKQISLKDVIYVLEGSMCLVECVESRECCSDSNQCVSRDIWIELSEKINETLSSITYENMVERYKNKQKSPVYSI